MSKIFTSKSYWEMKNKTVKIIGKCKECHGRFGKILMVTLENRKQERMEQKETPVPKQPWQREKPDK